MEDLDRRNSSVVHERNQLDDLAAIGLDWDGEVVRQSERFERYSRAIEQLTAAGLTYPCYCSRREIAEAISAPHSGPTDGSAAGSSSADADRRYPGTCRSLSDTERRTVEATGRQPAIRLRGGDESVAFTDRVAGPFTGRVDDVVLRRNDGVPAYNLAVVVDDAEQGIEEVVRGDDLLSSTPAQIHLGRLLGLPTPTYLHVPLVLGPTGARLAKRDGAVTLGDRLALGETVGTLIARLATSLGLTGVGERVSAHDLLDTFDPARIARAPWTLTQDELH